MNNTSEKPDLKMKDDVLTKLKHEPIVKVIDISILVKNGTATLK